MAGGVAEKWDMTPPLDWGGGGGGAGGNGGSPPRIFFWTPGCAF